MKYGVRVSVVMMDKGLVRQVDAQFCGGVTRGWHVDLGTSVRSNLALSNVLEDRCVSHSLVGVTVFL